MGNLAHNLGQDSRECSSVEACARSRNRVGLQGFKTISRDRESIRPNLMQQEFKTNKVVWWLLDSGCCCLPFFGTGLLD